MSSFAFTAVVYALVLAAATGTTWWGSGRLERAAERLARRYRLPRLVQGTLVVAVGSSFPELATTVISSLVHGEFELGMATIVGSAIFNILVIPGLAGLAGGGLRHDIRLVYRDAQFYLTSVAVLLLAFSFALIYRPSPDAELTGSLTRPIALVPLLLYGLYLFLQQQESRGRGALSSETPDKDPEAGDVGGAREAVEGGAGGVGRDWLQLVLGLLLVLAGVEGLLRTAIWLGGVLGTPSFLWGATVIAAATSIPDAIISIRQARQGDADVSLGNVLGSNIFDLLVAIPAGVLVAGAAVVDYTVAAPLMAFLTLATIVLFAILRTGLELERREAWLLLGLYGVFVLWLVLESAGVTAWIG